MKHAFYLKQKSKRNFNPQDKNDVNEYKKFMLKGGWGNTGCPFVVEYPYISIPHMIQEKIVKHNLNID